MLNNKTNTLKTLLLMMVLYPFYIIAGPFPPAAGQPGTTAIGATDPSISGWATAIDNYTVGANTTTEFQQPQYALNEAGNSDNTNRGFIFDIVSLGDGGSITLLFDQAITNGSGADFLVFENSFSDTFLELAWVEVSSNGTDFSRFPNFSLTPSPIGGFGSVDATNISGYAGKYRAGYGTPFDLNDLGPNPLVDINQITHIRIVDIVGNGTANDNWPNDQACIPTGGTSFGPCPIYDPHPTSGSAGFDLDAIAVIHFAVGASEENVPVPFFALFVFAITLIAIRLKFFKTTHTFY